MPRSGGSRLMNILKSVAHSNDPAPSSSTAKSFDPSSADQDFNDAPSSGGWKSSLGKALSAVSTGLSGVPAGGRPSTLGGLGQGARAEQAAQAAQQNIKFRSFDDSVKAASLHNQDQELQNHTQEQTDAHQKAQDVQHDWDEDHGLQYDTIPNTGSAATDYLASQTTANGSATVPDGSHLSADGKSILIPKQNSATQAAQLNKYNTFREVMNLPALPQGATFAPPKNLTMLQNKLEGHTLSGDVYTHDTIGPAIADLKSTRDALVARGGVDPAILKQANASIASMQAKSDYFDTHAASVAQANKGAEKQGETDVENDPTNQQAAATGAGLKAGAEEAAKAPYQADNRQAAVEKTAIADNQKLLLDPHSGYSKAVQQLNLIGASIQAGSDGNALITNLLPTMEVLGINHTAGVTRISPAEAQAAGTSPAWATRWNAFAQKATTGKLSPEMAKEGNELVTILKQGALSTLYQQQQVIAQGRGVSPAKLPSIDAAGNVTSFDKVMPSQQTAVYATNPQTKQRVQSTDGGKSWQQAR
jgi:hypothetical protein